MDGCYILKHLMCNLINNRRMFNLEIDDLAEKPYIPQKNYLYKFVANVLRDNIGILIFDLHGGMEAKHHTATVHFGTVGWTEG